MTGEYIFSLQAAGIVKITLPDLWETPEAVCVFTSKLLSISFSIISFRMEGEAHAVEKKKVC